jgi:hypothetical protein
MAVIDIEKEFNNPEILRIVEANKLLQNFLIIDGKKHAEFVQSTNQLIIYEPHDLLKGMMRIEHGSVVFTLDENGFRRITTFQFSKTYYKTVQERGYNIMTHWTSSKKITGTYIDTAREGT